MALRNQNRDLRMANPRLMEPQNPNHQWTVLQNQNLDLLMPKSLDLQIPKRPTFLIRISGISLIGSLMHLILNLDLQMPNPRLMEPQNPSPRWTVLRNQNLDPRTPNPRWMVPRNPNLDRKTHQTRKRDQKMDQMANP